MKNDEVDKEIEIVDSNDNILNDSLRFLPGSISQLQDNWWASIPPNRAVNKLNKVVDSLQPPNQGGLSQSCGFK
jgi:hypothetical protein